MCQAQVQVDAGSYLPRNMCYAIAYFFPQDALASDMVNSSTAISSSITSQSIDMNNIDGSGSDFSYHDDEDGDGDADDYYDYDDYDNFSYTDEYAILQSRLDNVHLPPGVEASLPWLKDPSPSATIPSTKNSTVSGPPSTKGTEVGSCSSITQADSNSSNQGRDHDDTVMEKFQSFKQFDMVDDFSDHHYKRAGFFEKQVRSSYSKLLFMPSFLSPSQDFKPNAF